MSEADPYFLGYRQAEQERLGRQAQELAVDSTWLFDQSGATVDWRVVEIGCGPKVVWVCSPGGLVRRAEWSVWNAAPSKWSVRDVSSPNAI